LPSLDIVPRASIVEDDAMVRGCELRGKELVNVVSVLCRFISAVREEEDEQLSSTIPSCCPFSGGCDSSRRLCHLKMDLCSSDTSDIRLRSPNVMESREDDVEVEGLSSQGVLDFAGWDTLWGCSGEHNGLFDSRDILCVEGKESAILGDRRIFRFLCGDLSIVPG